MEGAAGVESRRDMWSHVVRLSCLWLSQQAIHGQRKQANTWGSKEINASPFLVCRLYTERAWSLLGKHLESMEDAPVISFLSESKADKILMTCQALNQSLHHTQGKEAGVCLVPIAAFALFHRAMDI